ncbi:hypothetical protein [Dactylosporangium sp. CA-092794]|uniref:hypothetical protein n=1 Tax=Dactylosporangium sp. CA-092794 TaxID=3239929 RepID=UPI003D8E0AED
MRVGRDALPLAVWCLATAASIAVASLALRPVLRTAVPSDSVPLAATDDRDNRAVVTQTLPPPPVDISSAAGRTSAAGATTRPPSSAPAAPRTSAAQTSTAPPRVVDGWSVSTGQDGVDVYLKSFRSDGGDAVVRIRAGVVSLVTATPRDGYSVSQGQTEPSRLVVQFVAANGSAAYLVDCMWWQNAPHGEVTRVGG